MPELSIIAQYGVVKNANIDLYLTISQKHFPQFMDETDWDILSPNLPQILFRSLWKRQIVLVVDKTGASNAHI